MKSVHYSLQDPSPSSSPLPSPSPTSIPDEPTTLPPCPIDTVKLLKFAPTPRAVDCAAHGFMRRAAPAAIIDAFLLSYEVDALFLRLLELENVVDTFVIVESRESFTGERRSILWDTHGSCFERCATAKCLIIAPHLPHSLHAIERTRSWAGRIVRHVVRHVEGGGPWDREKWLRNQLSVGGSLAARNLTDRGFKAENILFAVSDIDEVPRALSYSVAKQCEGYATPIAMILDRFHYYSLNWRVGAAAFDLLTRLRRR